MNRFITQVGTSQGVPVASTVSNYGNSVRLAFSGSLGTQEVIVDPEKVDDLIEALMDVKTEHENRLKPHVHTKDCRCRKKDWS